MHHAGWMCLCLCIYIFHLLDANQCLDGGPWFQYSFFVATARSRVQIAETNSQLTGGRLHMYDLSQDPAIAEALCNGLPLYISD